MIEKQKAKIKFYYIMKSPYSNEAQLVGEVFDHPNQSSFQQQVQITSSLIKIDFVNKTAETLNTIYELVDE